MWLSGRAHVWGGGGWAPIKDGERKTGEEAGPSEQREDVHVLTGVFELGVSSVSGH